MTFAEFKAYFDENKADDEVKKLIGTIKPELTEPIVTAFLESDAGKPIVDRYINKAVRSHDEKRQPEIDKLIADAVERAKEDGKLSATDRMQKQMDELKAELSKRDSDLARRDLISTLRTKADEMHVPLELAVDLENPNLTQSRAVERMEAYAKRHADQINEEVNKRLINTAKPGSGTGAPPAGDIKKMSFEELVALEEKGELNAKIGV